MKTNAMTMNETRTSAMTKEQMRTSKSRIASEMMNCCRTHPSPSSWLRLMTAMNSIH